MANQPVVHQIGRYIVSIEDEGVCIFDPITESTACLPPSDAKIIIDSDDEQLIPWLESKFSRKRSRYDTNDQRPSRRFK